MIVDAVVQLVKTQLVPGTPSFLLLMFTAGLLLLLSGGRRRKWGRLWLVALAALYWTMSLPAVAGALERGLSRGYGQASALAARQASAIVVLGAGSITLRANGRELHLVTQPTGFSVLGAARLYAVMDDPLVIVSGGMAGRRATRPESAAMRDALLAVGVPRERILLESTSRTTHEQAVTLRPLLRAYQIDRFILVTRPSHMWRAMALFESRGMRPIPSVARARSEGSPEPYPWLPDWGAWASSSLQAYEYLAVGHAWVRGHFRGDGTPETAAASRE